MSFTRRALAVLVAASAVLLPLAPASSAQAARGTVYEGDGDDIIRFKAASTKPGIVKITHDGDGVFAVWTLNSKGKKDDLLAAKYGPYKGTVVYNGGYKASTKALSIQASGGWTAQLLPLTKARYWAVTSKGKSDEVLRLTKTSAGLKTLRIRHTGDGAFTVWTLDAAGKLDDLAVAKYGRYSGSVQLPPGTRYASIAASGPWSIVRK